MDGSSPVVSRAFWSDTYDAGAPPVAEVAPGQRFAVETRSHLTEDAFHRVDSYQELRIPVTGPVRIEGAMTGQVLRVEIHRLELADRGTMLTLPGRGGFGDDLATVGRVLDIDDRAVDFGGIKIPLRPMVGKLGVAAAVGGAAPSSSTVGAFGGNMDCTSVGVGAVVLLPVLHDGALLYVGDLHAVQADGEVSLTAVEVEGRVTLSCRLLDDVRLDRPMVLTGDTQIAIADGATLDEAVRTVLDDVAAMVIGRTGWSREEAAMFLSIAGDVGICQVVNPRVGVKLSLPVALCDLGLPLP